MRIPKLVKRIDYRRSNYLAGFVLGLLTGSAVGATLAVLVAPKSGAEVRKDLREAAERSAEALRNAMVPSPELGLESEPELG